MSKGVSNVPKTRVELHLHLDGAMRHETVYELLKQKKLRLPGNGSFYDLRKAVVVREPRDLGHFLAPFGVFLPAVQDDFKALERIAYELCEDKAREHVLYFEARYSPQAFLSPKNCTKDNLGEVISAIHRGFQRGEKDFKVKARSILCTLIGLNTAREVLQLYQEHSTKGLVGLDIASLFSDTKHQDEVPLNSEEARIYQEAKKLGINRTIHAGERGGAEMVRRAVDVYGCERIGHGYRVLEDEKLYRSCLAKNIHFECCPWSSYLTGSVSMAIRKHPMATFADDKANFSLSTDDPAVTGYELSDNYMLCQKWNFTEAIFVRSNLNAAQACFLPPSERDELVKKLKSNLGLY